MKFIEKDLVDCKLSFLNCNSMGIQTADCSDKLIKSRLFCPALTRSK